METPESNQDPRRVDDASNERDVVKRELLDVRASLKEVRRDLECMKEARRDLECTEGAYSERESALAERCDSVERRCQELDGELTTAQRDAAEWKRSAFEVCFYACFLIGQANTEDLDIIKLKELLDLVFPGNYADIPLDIRATVEVLVSAESEPRFEDPANISIEEFHSPGKKESVSLLHGSKIRLYHGGYCGRRVQVGADRIVRLGLGQHSAVFTVEKCGLETKGRINKRVHFEKDRIRLIDERGYYMGCNREQNGGLRGYTDKNSVCTLFQVIDYPFGLANKTREMWVKDRALIWLRPCDANDEPLGIYIECRRPWEDDTLRMGEREGTSEYARGDLWQAFTIRIEPSDEKERTSNFQAAEERNSELKRAKQIVKQKVQRGNTRRPFADLVTELEEHLNSKSPSDVYAMIGLLMKEIYARDMLGVETEVLIKLARILREEKLRAHKENIQKAGKEIRRGALWHIREAQKQALKPEPKPANESSDEDVAALRARRPKQRVAPQPTVEGGVAARTECEKIFGEPDSDAEERKDTASASEPSDAPAACQEPMELEEKFSQASLEEPPSPTPAAEPAVAAVPTDAMDESHHGEPRDETKLEPTEPPALTNHGSDLGSPPSTPKRPRGVKYLDDAPTPPPPSGPKRVRSVRPPAAPRTTQPRASLEEHEEKAFFPRGKYNPTEKKQQDMCRKYLESGERYVSREWELCTDQDLYVRADLREKDGTPWEVKDGDNFHRVQESLGQALIQRTLARKTHGSSVRSSLYYFTSGQREHVGGQIFEFLCKDVLNVDDYKEAVLAQKVEEGDGPARPTILARWEGGRCKWSELES